MMPTVSICLAVRNAAAFVGEAIDSVFRQTYLGAIKIVVVDDASEDSTPAALDRFRAPEIMRARNKRRLGIAATKNRALLLATGELRGILDADDYYAPEFVEVCVDAIQGGAEFVYTDNRRQWPDGHVTIEPAGEPFVDALRECNVRGDCWLARWDLLRRTGLHDPRFLLDVDYELFYQIAELTRAQRIPRPLQTVREHAGRSTRDPHAMAYWQAATLGKYGQSIQFAYRRSGEAYRQEIEQGYAFGAQLRQERG